MRTCEFCSTVNAESVDHCTSCGEPLTPEAARADERKVEAATQAAGMKNSILIGLGVVAAAGAIVVGIVMKKQRDGVRDVARGFYTQLRDADEESVNRYWRCIVRVDKLPQDNLQLEQALEAAVVKSKGGYAKHAGERCQSIIDGAPARLAALSAPAEVGDAFVAYADTLGVLATQSKKYIEGIGQVEDGTKRDDLPKKLGSNYHYADAESVETWAYDRFLRCAFPGFAEMTGTQDLLEAMHLVMKDPEQHVARWRSECYPLLEKTEGTVAHENYKAKVEAFSTDDRDVQAFQDTLKAANDKTRKARHKDLAAAWFDYATKRDALNAQLGALVAD